MNQSIEIIDNSKRLEDTIRRIWKRNVFFMWGYAFFFVATIIRATFNRICQFPRAVHNEYCKDSRPYVRKLTNYKWLNDWNLLVDSNYWRTFISTLFFITISISKTIYHIGQALFFLWKHVIKPLLWMWVVLLAAKSVSQGLSSSR